MPDYISKVVFGNTTLIDLTDDTVVASALLSGYTAHKADGALISGSCTFDADTRDATAAATEILISKTAYKNGNKLIGSMPNIGQQVGYITVMSEPASISQGYHDGSGTIGIATAEQSKIIPNNIRDGVSILGVVGTMTGSEDVKATSQTVTPYTTAKTYIPSEFGDYNYFAAITVASISYTTTTNAAGGLTVTIGAVAP